MKKETVQGNGQPENKREPIGIEEALTLSMDHYARGFASPNKRRIASFHLVPLLYELKAIYGSWRSLTAEDAIYQLQEGRGLNFTEEDEDSKDPTYRTVEPIFSETRKALLEAGESCSVLRQTFTLALDVLQAQKNPNELKRLRQLSRNGKTPRHSSGRSTRPKIPQ